MKRKKLKIRDLFFVALYGVKARKGRATLTSIGIGIGIAAIVAVSGISASGRADLLSTLESLGTNLIKASPQAGFFGTQEDLPKGVLGMVERIGLADAEIHYKSAQNKIDEVSDIPNHKIGLEKIVNLLLDKKVGVLGSTSSCSLSSLSSTRGVSLAPSGGSDPSASGPGSPGSEAGR